jgi:Domain of unknown function (DUF4269)
LTPTSQARRRWDWTLLTATLTCCVTRRILRSSRSPYGLPSVTIRASQPGNGSQADARVIANFEAEGWTFELFGSRQPAEEQIGWRHFRIEQRLLQIGGEALRTLIIDERRKGLKTEPAFSAVLNLSGNPYEALLDLETLSEAALADLLSWSIA